jgi:hypothetical protein
MPDVISLRATDQAVFKYGEGVAAEENCIWHQEHFLAKPSFAWFY